MSSHQVLPLAAAALLSLACASAPTVRETTIERSNTAEGSAVTVTRRVNDRELSMIREEWSREWLEAEGSAPLVERYPEEARNRELARLGAVLDARTKLAEMVSAVRVTSTVTMSDLATSQLARSEVRATLEKSEVMSQEYLANEKRWVVKMRMPKDQLVRLVERFR